MRKYLLLFAGGLLLSLSGCHTSAELEGDGYRIRTDSGGIYRRVPSHCPPGHAKKGWC